MSKTPERPHVLVAAVPVYSHFDKLRVIADGLVRRGYKVSFLTSTAVRDSVEKIGARFVPLLGTANYDGTKLDEYWPERASIPAGFEKLCFDMRHVFIDHIAGQYVAVQKFLLDASILSREPVVMIQDTTFLGAFPPILGSPGLRPAGLISAGITPVPLSSIDTAPFNSGLPPDSSVEGRIRNVAMNQQAREMLSQPQADWVQRLDEVGATDTRGWFMDQWVTLPDRYLQLSIKELEYPRSDAPSTLRYVGALPIGTQEDPHLPPWWDVIVKHEKRLVVVSQGTVSNDPDELIIPTLEALKDLDIVVVATLVRNDRIEGYEVPPNVLIAKFIPFDELFKHTDIVISNGGYGTIQHAFKGGVPMVLAGMSEDKPEGNARAAWTGAAINLATQRPQLGQVREAVETILSTPSYKARAVELQAEYRKIDCLENIAATIDELALAAAKKRKL
ncbi:hypothetical protein MMC24_007427 [Lignoscripta atroalba]|nr:hypothetical protein [Lignoscripta atroalba]